MASFQLDKCAYLLYCAYIVMCRAAASTRVVNYSSNFLLLEYSLISISGCKFPFPVAVFAAN